MWQQWLIAILGIWLIMLPYIGLSDPSLRTWVLITGIVVAILGFWGAMQNK